MVLLELCSWGHSLRLLLQRSVFSELQVYFIALIFGHTSFWEKAIPWHWSCNLRWGEERHVTLDAAVLCSPAVPKFFCSYKVSKKRASFRAIYQLTAKML